MAGEGAVQVLLYLQVPVPAGGVPVRPNFAQLAGPTLCARSMTNALACISKDGKVKACREEPLMAVLVERMHYKGSGETADTIQA